MTDAEALAVIETLRPWLDPYSLDYAASQWLACTSDYERQDWAERMATVLRWWTDPEWRESLYALSPRRKP